MSAEPLAERHTGEGPPWRVAVVRPSGQTARLAASDVAAQLRAAGWTASEVHLNPRDPFIDHRSEWAGRAERHAYDLIAMVGDLSPAVVALAVLVDAPLICLPISPMPSAPAAIGAAAAGGRTELVPVAEINADGDQRFTTDPVRVLADGDAVVQWIAGSSRRRSRVPACEVRPAGSPDGVLELKLPETAPISCRGVEVQGGDLSLRIDFDDRSRRGRRVAVHGVPQGLRILRVAAPR